MKKLFIDFDNTIVDTVKATCKLYNKKYLTNIKPEDITRQIESLTALMNVAVKALDFERAIELRDKIEELKAKADGKSYKKIQKVEKVRNKVYERTRKSTPVR